MKLMRFVIGIMLGAWTRNMMWAKTYMKLAIGPTAP